MDLDNDINHSLIRFNSQHWFVVGKRFCVWFKHQTTAISSIGSQFNSLTWPCCFSIIEWTQNLISINLIKPLYGLLCPFYQATRLQISQIKWCDWWFIFDCVLSIVSIYVNCNSFEMGQSLVTKYVCVCFVLKFWSISTIKRVCLCVFTILSLYQSHQKLSIKHH